MIPVIVVLAITVWSIPRESGDDPSMVGVSKRTVLYSPRERG